MSGKIVTLIAEKAQVFLTEARYDEIIPSIEGPRYSDDLTLKNNETQKTYHCSAA